MTLQIIKDYAANTLSPLIKNSFVSSGVGYFTGGMEKWNGFRFALNANAVITGVKKIKGQEMLTYQSAVSSAAVGFTESIGITRYFTYITSKVLWGILYTFNLAEKSEKDTGTSDFLIHTLIASMIGLASIFAFTKLGQHYGLLKKDGKIA